MSEPMTDSGPEKRLDFTIEAELGTTAGVRSAAVTLFSWRKEKTAMERKHGEWCFGSIGVHKALSHLMPVVTE